MRFFPNILIALIILFTCQQLPAQDNSQPSRYGFSMGPGVIISDKPYKGMDARVNAFPFISYQGPDFYLRGPGVGYKAFDNEKLSLNIIGNWRFDGYEDDDSKYLEDMDSRKMTAELGIALDYTDGFGKTKLSILNDVLGRHDGQVIHLSYSKTFRSQKLSLTPSTGIQWHSGKFVNYYYGIKSSEVAPGRPRYHPGDSFDPFIALQLIYRISEKWDIFSNIKYQQLGKEIYASPIVDQDHKISFMLGLIYRF
ncbi:MAG: MipA/OmpV family protein [Phycisphaerae bacterium]|nr:MipA/OmpV family protein [Phycisphaerae bacterium]